MNGQARLVDDLKALRRGYGIAAIDLKAHVGPELGALAGVKPGDPVDVVRRKVRRLLDELIRLLPEPLRPILTAAFGLASGAYQPRYVARVEQLARERSVDGRTIQRRIDEAIDQMAELATSRNRPGDRPAARQPPWRTTRLKVFLTFDLTVPEVFELRRVVALRDSLAELELGMTLTPPPGWTGGGSLEELGVDLLHGGRLTGRTMRSSNRIAFRLRLPAPMLRGQEHEYALRLRLPVDRGIAPLYACTPDYECDSFELGIRFREDSAPVRVWRLAGVSPLELDDEKADRTPIRPNAFGEVHETFADLEPRLSYGVGWQPP